METENINKMDTEELWNTFDLLMEEEDENGKPLKKKYENEIRLIKEGFRIKIPIWYLTQGWYEIYPSGARAKVLHYGKYSLKDFMEEKEKREKAMRAIIMENEEEGPSQPRT